jgi:hypothetical protein
MANGLITGEDLKVVPTGGSLVPEKVDLLESLDLFDMLATSGRSQ